MTYPMLTVNTTSGDLTQLFIYFNDVTSGLFMPLTLVAFFIIIFIGSFYAQIRFSGKERIELSFAAASFSTFGMAVLLSSANGLLNPVALIISIALTIISVMWLAFSSD